MKMNKLIAVIIVSLISVAIGQVRAEISEHDVTVVEDYLRRRSAATEWSADQAPAASPRLAPDTGLPPAAVRSRSETSEESESGIPAVESKHSSEAIPADPSKSEYRALLNESLPGSLRHDRAEDSLQRQKMLERIRRWLSVKKEGS